MASTLLTFADQEARLAGAVPPLVSTRWSCIRIDHKLPRVLHGAGWKQPGHGVFEIAQ